MSNSQKNYFTAQEVANILKVSRETVYKWISEGKLIAVRAGRLTRVSQEALLGFLQPISKEKPQTTVYTKSQKPKTHHLKHIASPAVMGRREFIIGAGAAFLGGLLSIATYDFTKRIIENRQLSLVRSDGARDLFEDLFGRLGPIHSYSVGRRSSSGNYPPDNTAAAASLAGPLGILDTPPHELAPDCDIDIDPDGDVVLFGGPNSTPLTMIAWQFEGSSDRELRRPANPIIPLPYYGISDATDTSVLHDCRIGWIMESVGPVSTVNWPFLDTKTEKRIRPQPGKRIMVKDKEAYLPLDNYLLVTRLPNFLSTDFRNLTELDLSIWPRLLVFDGNHGLGTRAAELLCSSAGLDALKSAKDKLRGATFFQILFKLSKIDLSDKGFHKFTTIELYDAVSLDVIGIEILTKANEYAADALNRLRQGSSGPFVKV